MITIIIVIVIIIVIIITAIISNIRIIVGGIRRILKQTLSLILIQIVKFNSSNQIKLIELNNLKKTKKNMPVHLLFFFSNKIPCDEFDLFYLLLLSYENR